MENASRRMASRTAQRESRRSAAAGHQLQHAIEYRVALSRAGIRASWNGDLRCYAVVLDDLMIDVVLDPRRELVRPAVGQLARDRPSRSSARRIADGDDIRQLIQRQREVLRRAEDATIGEQIHRPGELAPPG